MLIDTDHRVASTDGSIFRLLDVSPDDLLGRDVTEVVRSSLKHRFKDPDTYEASFERLLCNPDEILEEALVTAGPIALVIHRYSAPLFDQHHRLLGRVEIYSDITKRREIEASVRDAYEQLKATQERLIQSEKLRAVGEIASGVAHDFNNTLGIILGNIQLLLRTVKDESALSRLRAAERAALDAVDTVRRIQAFTQAKLQGSSVVVDLGKVVSEVAEMTKPVWKDEMQGRGCSVRMILDTAETAHVLGDSSDIREVLINIVLNALQAMPAGGSIRISTGHSKSWSWVGVEDNGAGMSEDVRRRVFDPFFTTRGVEGTGLGMSMAYGIIKRHGGRISVESEVGKGTVVTVFLPTAQEGSMAEEAPIEQVVTSSQRARILVVDDEELFADVMAEMLTECGYVTCVARSGAEAMDRFKEEEFDMVFTDLGMPHMSGLQLARALKDIEPHTPVALLTGWGETLTDGDLGETYVDIVLSKPIKLEKLSSVVAEVLNLQQTS